MASKKRKKEKNVHNKTLSLYEMIEDLGEGGKKLSAKEELEIAGRIAGGGGTPEDREKLILSAYCSILEKINSKAGYYKGRETDLAQDAFVLIRGSLDTYLKGYTGKAAFSSYVSKFYRQNIKPESVYTVSKAVRDNVNDVKRVLPDNLPEGRKSIKEIDRTDLSDGFIDELTLAVINDASKSRYYAAKEDIPEAMWKRRRAKVEEALEIILYGWNKGAIPIDIPVGQAEKESSLHEVIPDPGIQEPIEIQISSTDYSKLREEMTPLERIIFDFETQGGQSFIDYTDKKDVPADAIERIWDAAVAEGAADGTGNISENKKRKILNDANKHFKRILLASLHETKIRKLVLEPDDFSLFRELTNLGHDSYDESYKDILTEYVKSGFESGSAEAAAILNDIKGKNSIGKSVLDTDPQRRTILYIGLMEKLSVKEVNDLLQGAGLDALYPRIPGDCSLMFAYDKGLSFTEWKEVNEEMHKIIKKCARSQEGPEEILRLEKELREAKYLRISKIKALREAIEKHERETSSQSITRKIGNEIADADDKEEFYEVIRNNCGDFVELRQRTRRIILKALINYAQKEGTVFDTYKDRINRNALAENYVEYYGQSVSGKDIKKIGEKFESFLKGCGDYCMLDRTSFLALLSFLEHVEKDDEKESGGDAASEVENKSDAKEKKKSRVNHIGLDQFNAEISEAGYMGVNYKRNGIDKIFFDMMNGTLSDEVFYNYQLERISNEIRERLNRKTGKETKSYLLANIPGKLHESYGL